MSNVRFPFSHFVLALIALLSVSCGESDTGRASEAAYESLVSEYIEAWKGFYPGRAASMGLEEYRGRAEDRSPAGIGGWISFNDSILTRIASAPTPLPLDLRIDLRLVRNQGRAELG